VVPGRRGLLRDHTSPRLSARLFGDEPDLPGRPGHYLARPGNPRQTVAGVRAKGPNGWSSQTKNSAVHFIRGERQAEDFLVVTDKHTLPRERRVRPDDVPAARRLGRFQEMSAVNLPVALRRQFGQDQVALVVEDYKAVPLRHQEGGRADGLLAARGCICLPELLAVVFLETAQLAIRTDAVDMAILQHWRGH